MSSFHSGQRIKCGNLLRYATEQFTYTDELVYYNFKARDKVRITANYVGDPDCGEFRADNTKGWKAHKHRHQWEHRLLESIKHSSDRTHYPYTRIPPWKVRPDEAFEDEFFYDS